MDSGLEGNTKEGEIYRRYKNELNSDELSDEEALRAYKCGALPHDPASPVRA